MKDTPSRRTEVTIRSRIFGIICTAVVAFSFFRMQGFESESHVRLGKRASVECQATLLYDVLEISVEWYLSGSYAGTKPFRFEANAGHWFCERSDTYARLCGLIGFSVSPAEQHHIGRCYTSYLTRSSDMTPLTSGFTIQIPFEFIAFLFALPLAFQLALKLRRRARRKNDLCEVCGYNLIATPERCPECGALSSEAKNGNAARK